MEEEEEEDFINSKEDVWSEEEFQVTFKNAPEWAKRMMAFLKSSVSMLKQTSMSLKTELSVVKNQVAEVRKENPDKIDQIERSVAHVRRIFKSWKEEKAVLTLNRPGFLEFSTAGGGRIPPPCVISLSEDQ